MIHTEPTLPGLDEEALFGTAEDDRYALSPLSFETAALLDEAANRRAE